MRARVRKFVAVVATGLLPLPASPGNAEIVNKLSTIDGIRLEYKVVLPRNYDPQKAYPAVLAFPPGGQDMDMVDTPERSVRTQSDKTIRPGHRSTLAPSPLPSTAYQVPGACS